MNMHGRENYFLEKAKERGFDTTKDDETIEIANAIIDADDWLACGDEVDEVIRLLNLNPEVNMYGETVYNDGTVEKNWENLVLDWCEYQTGRNAYPGY